MKMFTIIKTGYTAGSYGCSGEYFTLIAINGKNHSAIKFNGMYGAEQRVQHELEKYGYKYFYTSGEYGRLSAREIHKPTNYSEYTLINGGKLKELAKSLINKRGTK
jgi:hypothetical protein